jgi:tRNA threonylcarbamoyladenosine biosynthesis protein TsaB
MESPAQIVARHRCVLVLDAASTVVQAGLLRAGLPPSWHQADGDAGQLVFTLTARCLGEAGLETDAVGAFIYCDGPGSMLGTRTVAMALRTWQTLRVRPAYAYHSLALAAVSEQTRTPGSTFALIADARRDSWHTIVVTAAGESGPLQRLATTELPAGELRTPGNFRAWSTLARPVTTCGYDLAALFAAAENTALCRAVDTPDVCQLEAPAYRQWTPAVHQAPAAKP